MWQIFHHKPGCLCGMMGPLMAVFQTLSILCQVERKRVELGISVQPCTMGWLFYHKLQIMLCSFNCKPWFKTETEQECLEAGSSYMDIKFLLWHIHCTSKSMKITSTFIVFPILTWLILLVSRRIDGLVKFLKFGCCLVFCIKLPQCFLSVRSAQYDAQFSRWPN